MRNPEEEVAQYNDDNDNPRNSSNDQENAQTLESDLSGDGTDSVDSGEVEADTDAIDVASRAAEPSYTLNLSEDDQKSE
ncbi:hypothetical protein [Mucilaginibacter ginkgonis]|uniref:Uncharacterized protein n=1 Tax=Mucilaginibacter ginkgonis TaxID=2682091 RepID=A0A6I4HWA5_9SPHI|nr:hypothetical protein [Mucilaginibacter ginkgonis]QQL51120.1 hypothetical protein GO620_006630 [Mucilaginibacter ginkgonis]